LVERGIIRLDDTVCSIIPEFADGDKKDRILVRHLLTHTSGLPDQLPENRELRSQHAQLEDFLQKVYKTPILFEPGTNISYQSCGMTMLMGIVQRVTGRTLAEFALREIFEPLGMRDTSYGVNWSKADRVSQVNIPTSSFQYGEAGATDWNWNSRYWRSLGSPWGGMVSTQADLIKLMNMFLGQGSLGERQILSPETVRAMTSNQVETFRSIPKDVRHNNPWGFGWQLKTPFNTIFADLVSSKTFGHGGATGTLVWADPQTALACVILTNQPFEESSPLMSKFSNAVVGSLSAAQKTG
jgi:CubicO group peptidase (beta-lactamase class C family)